MAKCETKVETGCPDDCTMCRFTTTEEEPLGESQEVQELLNVLTKAFLDLLESSGSEGDYDH